MIASGKRHESAAGGYTPAISIPWAKQGGRCRRATTGPLERSEVTGNDVAVRNL